MCVICRAAVQVRMPGQPDSYEFSIKTPVTPVRWADYDAVTSRSCWLVLASGIFPSQPLLPLPRLLIRWRPHYLP